MPKIVSSAILLLLAALAFSSGCKALPNILENKDNGTNNNAVSPETTGTPYEKAVNKAENVSGQVGDQTREAEERLKEVEEQSNF